MRQENIDFIDENLTEKEAKDKNIIEIGSYDVNGSIKPTFLKYHPKTYLGVDMQPGSKVDLVMKAEDLVEEFDKNSFDVVVSCDALEHMVNWKKIVSNMKNILKEGGILYMTVPSKKFPYHGYPYDFWRFEEDDLKNIFSDFEIIKTSHNGEVYASFIKAIKPKNFNEKNLENYELYSIITKNKTANFEGQISKNYLKLENDFKEIKKELEKNKKLVVNYKEVKNTAEKSFQIKIEQTEKQLEQTKNRLFTSNQKIQSLIKVVEQQKRTENEIKDLNKEIIDFKTLFCEMEYKTNANRPLIQRLISRLPSLYIMFNRGNRGIRNVLVNIKGYREIKRNKLVDIGYYLINNRDVRLSGMDPILHYLYYGYREGRNPNPKFSTENYLKRYGDVKKSDLNPLVHYSLYGIKEGRKVELKKKDSFH